MGWWDEQAAPAPAAAAVDWLGEVQPAAPAPQPRKVAKAPKADLIPAADAWLIFRTTTAPDDPEGPVDHVEGLRVVRGRDLNARQLRMLRGEAKDYDWDVPLMHPLYPAYEDSREKWLRLLGGDPETDPNAAWRLHCLHWRYAPEQFDAAAEEISKVEGLEWVATQWQRGKKA